MSSLIDRDNTNYRENTYPNTAGNLIKRLSEPIVQAHTDASAKYVDWIQELLKRDDVHFAIKIAILGGEDPLTFGGSLPAVMMAKLEPLGVQHAKVAGGMVVSENNKARESAKTGVESVTNAGVGTAFWNLNEQLTVRHSNKSDQKRETDYRAHVDWEVEYAPQGEPEGVNLIKESVGRVFQAAQNINETLANAKLEAMKANLKPASSDDADKFLAETDPKTPPPDGDAPDSPQEPTEESSDSGDESDE